MAETTVAGGRARVAIIGGSGLYRLDGLTDVEELRPETPYGPPSDTIVVGTLAGPFDKAQGRQRVAFLPRHGAGHRLLPAEVPSRANIHALKLLGVELVIAMSAVGSLREKIRPLDLVVPDQLIDRTRGRPSTFFGEGLVAHVAFADPFCPRLAAVVAGSALEAGAVVHPSGTYVVIEGPAFSTRAESHLYRSWGADVIGMTALPEAKLAREAEMCYAIVACATDYDCWHEVHGDVTAEMIVANLTKSVAVSQQAVRLALGRLPAVRECACAGALKDALVTPLELVPEGTLQRLAPLIDKYPAYRRAGAREEARSTG